MPLPGFMTIRIRNGDEEQFACQVPIASGPETTVKWHSPQSVLPGDWPDYRWRGGGCAASRWRPHYPYGPKKD